MKGVYMAQRGIREYDGKRILFKELSKYYKYYEERANKLVLVTPETDYDEILKNNEWLKKKSL